jgi:hypothetical protein
MMVDFGEILKVMEASGSFNEYTLGTVTMAAFDAHFKERAECSEMEARAYDKYKMEITKQTVDS